MDYDADNDAWCTGLPQSLGIRSPRALCKPRPHTRSTIGAFGTTGDDVALTPPYHSFLRLLSLSPLHSSLSPSYTVLQSTTCFQSSPSQLPLGCHSCDISSPAPDETSIMAEYGTVPQEADNKQDALEESGVAQLSTDGEEDAPQETPSGRQDFISSSKYERLRIHRPRRYSLTDCPDVGCTWPCAHHFHVRGKQSLFHWYQDLDYLGSRHPKIPRFLSEMKVGTEDCQFCGIFFSIRKSDCACGANARNELILESGGCRFKYALCAFRSNGKISHVRMEWTCGRARYELGLPTGKVVWSLYNLFKETFLTLANSRSRRRPRFPIHSAMHGHIALQPGI